MRDVWLILCAAAAMLTAVPALRRLDAYLAGRMERGDDGEEQAAETEEAPDTSRPGK